MKTLFRASALACVLGSALLLSAPAARAADVEGLRTAQMRLADLGYYVGRYDGMMGPVTRSALIDFQRNNGLPVSGRLTAETYGLLLHKASILYAPGSTAAWQNAAMPMVAWDTRWHYARTESLPLRFARLDVSEDQRGSLRHYAVTLNGQPVLFANNQPGILRVSQTYAMKNEDAVIFTAYEGDSSCAYKNYLLTVRRDGSFTRPQMIGNCASSYEAHVANNALFISFPGVGYNGWSTWDTWRYRNGNVNRI